MERKQPTEKGAFPLSELRLQERSQVAHVERGPHMLREVPTCRHLENSWALVVVLNV